MPATALPNEDLLGPGRYEQTFHAGPRRRLRSSGCFDRFAILWGKCAQIRPIRSDSDHRSVATASCKTAKWRRAKSNVAPSQLMMAPDACRVLVMNADPLAPADHFTLGLTPVISVQENSASRSCVRLGPPCRLSLGAPRFFPRGSVSAISRYP
jgi:hypothetical protein